MKENRLTIMEAIARKHAVSARYNGGEMILAPHLLFERRGDLFVSALNLSKVRRADDVSQLGQFKLEGLGMVALTEVTFEPIPSFQPKTPRLDDTLIFAI
jgi:hypothetical protein